MKHDSRGWIKTLLDEAENERMHLAILSKSLSRMHLSDMSYCSRRQFLELLFFVVCFFPKIAHRMVGYFEEQAVISYTQYLEEIEAGTIENVQAPSLAIDYYELGLCHIEGRYPAGTCRRRGAQRRKPLHGGSTNQNRRESL